MISSCDIMKKKNKKPALKDERACWTCLLKSGYLRAKLDPVMGNCALCGQYKRLWGKGPIRPAGLMPFWD